MSSLEKSHRLIRNTTGRFSQKYLGSQKIAPINMKKEEHQFVIDGYLVDEVLKQIPAGLKIIQAYIWIVKREPERRIIVQNHLRRYGCTQIREIGSGKKVAILFDETNKETINTNIHKICENLLLPPEKAYFEYIVLRNADATVKFVHCTKEIKPDETDQRKKLRVLGASEGVGKVQGLIAQLNAKKYKCVIKQETAKVIMCYKE